MGLNHRAGCLSSSERDQSFTEHVIVDWTCIYGNYTKLQTSDHEILLTSAAWFISDPAARRSLTTVSCPFSDAIYNGVHPFCQSKQEYQIIDVYKDRPPVL